MKLPFTRGRIALLVLAVAYLGSAWWLFTRGGGTPDRAVTKIRIAHWQIEYGPPDGLAAVIRRYRELRPDIEVEQVLVPGRIYRQWLRTNLVGGTGADLIEYGSFLPGMRDVPTRYFEPITALMNEPNPYNRGTPLEHVPWRNTFHDGLFTEQLDTPEIGQLYSVTLCQVNMRLFCNERMLREITGDDPAFKFPVTLEEFRRLAARTEAYARRQGRTVYMLAGAKLNAEWLFEFMLTAMLMNVNVELDRDGQLMNYLRDYQIGYLRNRWSYRRPDVQAALGVIRELAAMMRPGFVQLERDDAVREFMTGQALFVATGTWDATSLIRLAPFPVGIHRFPQPDAADPAVGSFHIGRAADSTRGTSMGFYLNNAGPHKEAAIDFMRFMSSQEAGQLFMDHSGWISAIRGTRLPPVLAPAKGDPDGYSMGGGYMKSGADTARVFTQSLYRLAGPQGGVAQFVATIEPEMPGAIRADLQFESRSLLEALRPQDSGLVARRRLGPAEAGRAEALATSQTLAESKLYEDLAVLAESAPRP